MAALTPVTKISKTLTVFTGRYCSPEFSEEAQSERIFLIAVNIFVSITVFLGTTLILSSCPTQGNFTVDTPSKDTWPNLTSLWSAVRLTSLSKPGDNWSLCWNHYRTLIFWYVTYWCPAWRKQLILATTHICHFCLEPVFCARSVSLSTMIAIFKAWTGLDLNETFIVHQKKPGLASIMQVALNTVFIV